jgi:cytochrome b561
MPLLTEKPVGVSNSYDSLAMSLHWLTAILVLAAFIMGPGGSEQRVYSVARDSDRLVHELLGLSVFLLTVLRLAWQVFAAEPVLPAMRRWMRVASKALQGLMYLLLIATPVTAVLGAWLEGHPLTFWMLGEVPPMIAEAHATGAVIAEIHTWLGDAIIWLAGLHAAAAVFHQWVLRDGLLQTMLPARWKLPF